MRIDTHCHIDLFANPVATAQAFASAQTGCVLATMLPSHYQAALPHVKPFRTIWPALGMHPLRASEGKSELSLFLDLVYSAECIGEIGMDLSAEGQETQDIQSGILKRILPAIGRGKFVTVHSRNAHEEVGYILDEYDVRPVCFHYFIGGPLAAEKLATKGHYFSINHRMLTNKHKSIVEAVPRDRILVESDAPFLTKRPLATIEHVYEDLSKTWNIEKQEAIELIYKNYTSCRTRISPQL